LINFQEEQPSVGSNSLPSHEIRSINVIEGRPNQLIREVEKVKTPLQVIFLKLCQFKMIEGEVFGEEMCGFHSEVEHHIEECDEFKQLLQGLIDSNLVQICHLQVENNVLETQSKESPKVTPLKPLVIHFSKNIFFPTSPTPKPITLKIPTPFPYKSDKAIPWNYGVTVHTGDNINERGAKDFDVENTVVTNIVGVGRMTRSGKDIPLMN